MLLPGRLAGIARARFPAIETAMTAQRLTTLLKTKAAITTGAKTRA